MLMKSCRVKSLRRRVDFISSCATAHDFIRAAHGFHHALGEISPQERKAVAFAASACKLFAVVRRGAEYLFCQWFFHEEEADLRQHVAADYLFRQWQPYLRPTKIPFAGAVFLYPLSDESNADTANDALADFVSLASDIQIRSNVIN